MAFARAAARAMMPRLVGYGWSTSQIVGWLGKYDATYRRVTMLSDIRQFQQMSVYGSRIINYKSEKLLPKSYMSEVDLNRPVKYRIYGTGRYTNTETGAVSYRYLSFYADERRSKEGWSSTFLEMQLKDGTDPIFVIDNVNVGMVEHNKGLSY